MGKQNKQYSLVKFSGSLALLLTVAGVLLAIGGQLDFLGNERQVTESIEQSAENSLKKSDEKAKYSFYDELRKRKAEVDKNQPAGSVSTTNKADLTESYRYVVQVAAFAKETDASKVLSKLKKLGYPGRIEKSSNNKYLVQVGPYQGKMKSQSVERQLRSQKMDTLLKRLK